jgi:Leucine-rich repeat (LRR) protein
MGICFSDNDEKEIQNRFDNGKITKVYKLDNLNLKSLNQLNKYQISGIINVLSAKNNSLKELTQEFFDKIIEIKKINLSFNEFKEFPNIPVNLTSSIKILDLSNNQIEEIPILISKFIKIKELNLSTNKINSIPNDLTNLKELETLNLSNNNINSFSNNLISLEQLSFLNISKNKISIIPEKNWDKSKLIQLDLSYNKISKIPDEIFGQSKITILKLKGNNLTISDIKDSNNFDKYLERRKMLKDQGFKHDLNMSFSLCGLD